MQKKVAYLGPIGSFSNEAALKLCEKDLLVPKNTVSEIFTAIKNKEVAIGVVPIENSTGGSIDATLDELIQGSFFIHNELTLQINQSFLSNSKKENISRIYSHPQGFLQCKKWLDKNMKGIECIEVSSTSKAAELAAKEKNTAAIGSELAAKAFQISILEKDIQDTLENATRFVSISIQKGEDKGKKTGLIFGIKNKPGALFDILFAFKENNVNMTKIESRPSKKKNWEYLFFVEIEGNLNEPAVKKALEKIKLESIECRVLGSY